MKSSQVASDKRICVLEKNLNILYAAENSMKIGVNQDITKVQHELKQMRQILKTKQQNEVNQKKLKQ